MMLNLKHMAVTLALVGAGFSAAGTAQAEQMRDFDGVSPQAIAHSVSYVKTAQYPQYAQKASAERNVSYAQAKSIARRQVPGSQVVDIKLKGQNYRVRLQTQDGRVVDVYVDAATGRVR